MSAANLEAVDRVVKIVRELDRYHGFAVPGRDAETAPSPAALGCPSRARGAGRADGTNWRRNRLRPLDSRAEMAASEIRRPYARASIRSWPSFATRHCERSAIAIHERQAPYDHWIASSLRSPAMTTAVRPDCIVLSEGRPGRSPAPPGRCSPAARHAPKGRRGGRRRAGPSPPRRERTARGERPPPARSRTAPA